MKPIEKAVSRTGSCRFRISDKLAAILQYAGAMCHGNTIDQMAHDATKERIASAHERDSES